MKREDFIQKIEEEKFALPAKNTLLPEVIGRSIDALGIDVDKIPESGAGLEEAMNQVHNHAGIRFTIEDRLQKKQEAVTRDTRLATEALGDSNYPPHEMFVEAKSLGKQRGDAIGVAVAELNDRLIGPARISKEEATVYQGQLEAMSERLSQEVSERTGTMATDALEAAVNNGTVIQIPLLINKIVAENSKTIDRLEGEMAQAVDFEKKSYKNEIDSVKAVNKFYQDIKTEEIQPAIQRYADLSVARGEYAEEVAAAQFEKGSPKFDQAKAMADKVMLEDGIDPRTMDAQQKTAFQERVQGYMERVGGADRAKANAEFAKKISGDMKIKEGSKTEMAVSGAVLQSLEMNNVDVRDLTPNAAMNLERQMSQTIQDSISGRFRKKKFNATPELQESLSQSAITAQLGSQQEMEMQDLLQKTKGDKAALTAGLEELANRGTDKKAPGPLSQKILDQKAAGKGSGISGPGVPGG